MTILFWIIFGALAGWIASIILGKNSQMGAIGNIVIGIGGAFLGGFLSTALGGPDADLGSPGLSSVFIAILGAVLLLWIINLIRRNTRT